MSTQASAKTDVYQEVTDRIVSAIEAGGTLPWVKPWRSCGVPRNAITGRPYTGINTILLAMAPFASNEWLTYNQAKQVGAQVRKGEQGTQVVLFKPFKVTDKNDPDSKEKTIPLLRSFTVFNVAQIDNLPNKFAKPTAADAQDFSINEQAESMLAHAVIEHGSNQACYVPSRDKILMPHKADFKSISDYYATALHELTHWTGHTSRLARDFTGRFGDESYAFEELVAELGAAFLCASCSIDGTLQHDNYIAHWLKVLKADKKAIFTAASAARKSTEFISCDAAHEQEQEAA